MSEQEWIENLSPIGYDGKGNLLVSGEDWHRLTDLASALEKENSMLHDALMQIAQGDMWTATAEDIAAWALGLKEDDK